MMFKSKLAAFVSIIVFAGSTFSSQHIPNICPNTGLIKAAGLTMSAELQDGQYVAYNSNHYDTSANWIFILGPINAESYETALDEGNRMISTLTGNPYPQEIEEDSWICQYETASQSLTAFAIQVDDMISPLKMSRYLRRAN